MQIRIRSFILCL